MLCRGEATFDTVFELGAAKPTCVAYVDLDGHRFCIFGSLTTVTPYTTSGGIVLNMEHGSLYTLLQSNAALAIKYTTEPERSILQYILPLVNMHMPVMPGQSITFTESIRVNCNSAASVRRSQSQTCRKRAFVKGASHAPTVGILDLQACDIAAHVGEPCGEPSQGDVHVLLRAA